MPKLAPSPLPVLTKLISGTVMLCVMVALTLSQVGWAAVTANSQLNTLHGRIHRLQRDLSTTRTTKSNAEEALRRSELAISELNRSLRELALQKHDLQLELQQLRERTQATQTSLQKSRLGLDQILRALARAELASAPVLPQLESSCSCGDDSQREHFASSLTILALAQDSSSRQLENSLHDLGRVANQREAKLGQLAQIELRQKSQQQRLAAETKVRTKMVAELALKLELQQRSLESMRRAEKRLTQLVEDIARRLARRQSRPVVHPSSSDDRHPAVRNKSDREQAIDQTVPTPPALAMLDREGQGGGGYEGDGFSHLKGHLRLPLAGELTGRYGTARPESGLTWRGLFISAPEGREAHAVAPGKVVFADWLKGFGNLLILDHGAGFMSLYGNAQTLFVRLGENVAAGAVVASAGTTGGNSQSGLYFELRYQSKPFDPLPWLGRGN